MQFVEFPLKNNKGTEVINPEHIVRISPGQPGDAQNKAISTIHLSDGQSFVLQLSVSEVVTAIKAPVLSATNLKSSLSDVSFFLGPVKSEHINVDEKIRSRAILHQDIAVFQSLINSLESAKFPLEHLEILLDMADTKQVYEIISENYSELKSYQEVRGDLFLLWHDGTSCHISTLKSIVSSMDVHGLSIQLVYYSDKDPREKSQTILIRTK